MWIWPTWKTVKKDVEEEQEAEAYSLIWENRNYVLMVYLA